MTIPTTTAQAKNDLAAWDDTHDSRATFLAFEVIQARQQREGGLAAIARDSGGVDGSDLAVIHDPWWFTHWYPLR